MRQCNTCCMASRRVGQAAFCKPSSIYVDIPDKAMCCNGCCLEQSILGPKLSKPQDSSAGTLSKVELFRRKDLLSKFLHHRGISRRRNIITVEALLVNCCVIESNNSLSVDRRRLQGQLVSYGPRAGHMCVSCAPPRSATSLRTGKLGAPKFIVSKQKQAPERLTLSESPAGVLSSRWYVGHGEA
jgi:hypothetical protein